MMTQTGTVKGKVEDRDGKGLAGAEIQVEGTQLIAITDMEGSYSIESVPTGARRITASMVLGTETKPVNVEAGRTVLVNFTVKPL
jgi:hypothetical protein